uniref:WW domain-containing protein n=1 Tax=Hanusia phi TaxID=3032 RepID=A0A7S0HU04_9CRYP
MFGGSNQNSGGSSSIFGGSMPQGSTAPSGFGTGGLSGQSSAPGAPSIFGGSSTGLFGGQQSQQNPPQQSQGLFGSLNQNQPDKPSFFSNMPGSSSSVFGNLGGSSIFSSEPNNTQPSQSSLFGGPIGTAGSMFGGPPSTAPQTSSLFGNPSQTPPLQPSLLFDPSRNSFNPGSSNPQGNLFSPGAQAPPVSGLNQGSMGFLGQQGQQMGQLPTSQVNAELLRAKESIAHLERALGSINAPSAQTGAAREVVLPPGWAKQWDLNRQAFFYINCNNNPPTVQWEPPPAPLNPLPGDGNTNPTALSPLYSFLNRLWGSTPSVGSEVRPASHFPAAVVPAIDGVRSTWNSPGDIAVIRLLVSAFAGAAGSVFSIGQLLIFVFECLARIMAKRGAPLIASAVKGLLEGPAGGNQLSSYVRNMRFGSGPRGGTRPGAEQLLEPGRFLFICGGRRDSDNATTANTIIYDRMSGNWEAGPDMIRPRVSARAAVLNGELYVVGGWDGRSVLSSVERLDVSLGRWVRVADLRIPRASPALAVLDGFLYVMGGFDGQDWLRQVERYDAAKDEWEEVASLSAPRSAFGACALNGSIYAVGGSDGQMSQRSVEKYNPWEDRWVPIAGMTTRRENLGVAVVNGQIFAAGGFDSMWAEWLRTSERFDASACAWISAPDLKSPRRNCILLTFNGELLAIGGNDGKEQVKDVERLILDGSSMEGCWRTQPDLSLPLATSYFAAACS